MPIRQSLCYPIMKPADMSIDAFCKAAAETGFAAIELWGPGDDFDDVVKVASKHRLVVSSMCGHGSLGNGLNNRAEHDRIEAELVKSIDMAAKVGMPGVICFSGNRLPHQDEAQAIDAVADGFRRIAPYAEKKGVNLNLELLNSKVDHAGYQCDHTAWGAAVCEKVHSPRVKLLFDIYHMQIMEGDLIRNITQHIKWIGHFHTAGNPGRKDLDDMQELNYAGICRAIAATSYAGYVGHEFAPKGNLIETLRKTFAMCDA